MNTFISLHVEILISELNREQFLKTFLKLDLSAFVESKRRLWAVRRIKTKSEKRSLRDGGVSKLL